MEGNQEVKKTSIESTKKLEAVEADQAAMPTWGLIVALIAAFFILKSFVYIKDKKRHGK